jgi:hypothetical protein
MNIPSEKDVVGYGRPPEHSKWKKGQGGNPARIRECTAKPVVAMFDEFFASEHVYGNGAVVCTENVICVDEVRESPKLTRRKQAAERQGRNHTSPQWHSHGCVGMSAMCSI